MIKQIAALALVIGSLHAALAAPAQAGPLAGPDDTTFCGLAPMSDAVVVGQQRVLIVGSASARGADVTLTCSLHVGNGTHDGARTAEAADGPAAVAAISEVVTYDSSEFGAYYLCMEVTVAGDQTYYWDGQEWAVSPDAPCVWSDAESPALARVARFVHSIWVDVVDPELCPALRGLRDDDAPPVLDVRNDGDLYLAGVWVWDCPA